MITGSRVVLFHTFTRVSRTVYKKLTAVGAELDTPRTIQAVVPSWPIRDVGARITVVTFDFIICIVRH